MGPLSGQGAVYQQIIEYFLIEIASGRLAPGARIDSVRNLALMFRVNPNTVQKAMTELERDGLVVTDKTNGKFVSEDATHAHTLATKLSLDTTRQYVTRMKALGIKREEVLTQIEQLYEGEAE